MIALDLGVVKDEHQVFKWDGQTRDIAAWNRDHDLITAMKYSVVPVYQEFARQIGEARMSKMLHAFDYGNEDISGNVDSFGSMVVFAFRLPSKSLFTQAVSQQAARF